MDFNRTRANMVVDLLILVIAYEHRNVMPGRSLERYVLRATLYKQPIALPCTSGAALASSQKARLEATSGVFIAGGWRSARDTATFTCQNSWSKLPSVLAHGENRLRSSLAQATRKA